MAEGYLWKKEEKWEGKRMREHNFSRRRLG
jgi:hypothetical protein